MVSSEESKMNYTINATDGEVLNIYIPNPPAVGNPLQFNGFKCFSSPTGKHYSKGITMTYTNYAVYHQNVVTISRCASFTIQGSYITTQDSVNLITKSHSKDPIFALESEVKKVCPVKSVDGDLVTIEVSSSTHVPEVVTRQVVIGEGNCIVYKKATLKNKVFSKLDGYYAVYGSTMSDYIHDHDGKTLLFPNYDENATVSYKFRGNALNVHINGLICCEGKIEIVARIPYSPSLNINQERLELLTKDSELSIKSYERRGFNMELVLVHHHPLNIDFTILDL